MFIKEKSFCLILNVMTFHIAARMQALSDSWALIEVVLQDTDYLKAPLFCVSYFKMTWNWRFDYQVMHGTFYQRILNIL